MDALLGRGAETARLISAVRDLRRGRGGLAWIEGEPGIGKTALADVAVTAAREQGVGVFRTTAEEALRPFTLRPFAELLGGGDAVPDAIEEIAESVAARCAAGPLLIVVEDLQYADPGTLTAWQRLAVSELPLLLVGTAGPSPYGPVTGALRRLAAGGGGLVLDLQPLPADEALALFTRSLPARPGARLQALLEEAGGNPFYITELAAALARDDLLAEKGDRVELRPGGDAPPASLAAALDRRLRLLGTETHGLLRMAALLGGQFDVQELSTVLGRSPASMIDSLAEAHAAEVLTETGDGRLAFRHGLIRRALADELSQSLRAALHRQFAESLAEYGAPFEAVAAHLLAATGPAGPWVSGWLARLPERVLRVSAEPAATLLTEALDGLSLPPERREILATRLLPILRSLGRIAQTDEVAAELLRTSADPAHRLAAWLGRWAAANRSRRIPEALALSIAALDDPLLTPGGRALVRSRRASALLKLDRLDEAGQQAELAITEADAAGDPVAGGYARQIMSHIDPDPERALAHLDAAMAALTAAGVGSGAAELHTLLLGNRLAQLNNLGRRDEFRQATLELPEVIRRVGQARAASLSLAAAQGDYDFGAWDDALSSLDRMPRELPDTLLLGRYGLAALVHAHREEWDDAARASAVAGAIPLASGDLRIWSGYVVAADAMRAEASGDPEQAAGLLAPWADPSLGIDARERYMWLPGLTRLALQLGDTTLADAAVAAAAADTALPGALPMQFAAARMCAAQRSGDAAELLSVAGVFEAHGWLRMRALAYEEAAVRLAASGALEPARVAFNEAVRGFATIGASWDVRRADARLRPLGIRRGSRTLDQRPAEGWEALTAAERRVAVLVASGRSNPEVASELFLSPRTVQTHVTRILRKLGYTSRMDLVRSGPEPRA